MSVRSEKLVFPNAAGLDLAGRLELPEGPPRAFAIFAHCFTCSKDVAAAGRVARALGRCGFAVLRFDFTGLGNSEGDFANTNFSSNVADLRAAADFLRTHHTAPSLLLGHSLGGAAVLAVAADVPEARAVVTIGAPADPGHVRQLLVDAVDEIEARGEAPVQVAGRTFRIQKQFLDDLATPRFAERIRSMGKALLILHSPTDEVVDIDQARRIYEAARHPKSFLSLDGADHMLSRREDSEYAAEVIAAWSARYLDPAPGVASTTGQAGAPPAGTVVVEELDGGLTQRVRAGRHQLRADEPESLGGKDLGPGPYDYLLAGLGACTSMTLRMYARHKGWPLTGVSVSLSHDRIHAEDCATCEEQQGMVDRIERRIEVTGELSDEQRSRLAEIADRCPVHRTLENQITIPTTLVAGRSS